MPAILNNLKNVTHFVSEIYYASIFLPQKDKRTHKVAFENTPRNPSGNMNYRKQIFFNCYCKRPSLQLFLAYISISPANLVSFFKSIAFESFISTIPTMLCLMNVFFVLYYCVSFDFHLVGGLSNARRRVSHAVVSVKGQVLARGPSRVIY